MCSLDHECRPFDDFANWTLSSTVTNKQETNNTIDSTNNTGLSNTNDSKILDLDNDELDLPPTLMPS